MTLDAETVANDDATTQPGDVWFPGDPCGRCGSRETGWAVDTGAFCSTCGGCDSDE